MPKAERKPLSSEMGITIWVIGGELAETKHLYPILMAAISCASKTYPPPACSQKKHERADMRSDTRIRSLIAKHVESIAQYLALGNKD